MKKIVALLLSVLMLVSFCMPAAAGLFSKDEAVLRLIVPENWEMTIGDSRTVDLAADNTSNAAKWSADPADVASVDAYGRVTALKEGEAVITVTSKDDPDIYVEIPVKVNKPVIPVDEIKVNKDKIELIPVQYVGQMLKALHLKANTPPTFGEQPTV